jgi:dTDP-glucose 4,6-dehydratase
MKVLVTGAAGFIASHFCRVLRRDRPNIDFVILDALTYSGNRSTCADLEAPFYEGRIEDSETVSRIIQTENITDIVNFAAESHNDRSLSEGASFLFSNAVGVENLLNQTRKFGLNRMVHVSTDEVYGTISEGHFTESTPLAPNTPYSASKAAGDLQCRAHFKAYQTPVVVTRGGNTYGPFQYPEKLIPFFAVRLILGKKVPLYGDGSQIREWIHAEDHARGILTAWEHGTPGEAYNVGDVNERTNRQIVDILLRETNRDESLVKYIEDPRKGAHDARYSMTTDKIAALGWQPQKPFIESLQETIAWYQANESWWRPIIDRPEYQSFVMGFYGKSLGPDL